MKTNRKSVDLVHVSYPADTIRNNTPRYICIEDRFYLAAEINEDTINGQIDRDSFYSLGIFKVVKRKRLSDFNEDKIL